MIRKVIVLLAFFLASIPVAAFASYTVNSPEFKEVTGQLYMDGHSEHELSTCKVRKIYNSEVLEMLNEGMQPDEIISHYTDVLGPAALKAPDNGINGLFAWLMPVAGTAAGGVIAVVAIRRMTAAKKQRVNVHDSVGTLPDGDFASFEEAFENERKKYF
ncbi:hypothetical protein D1B31_11535 [Neobacillus notoginsengisoli]|uniref:Cytochrome c-type biogenesis protein n=1 Tax=Neobacillus notoginsengisoli TaxID=1578198 RepID=A0A417YUF6_9BACI|nr:cytochrome c-type biogenesis protein CcmH [Neobacillus notoginsengisoli]RHW40813.1 hypothetical protein D1B31_11535 [Neobacillus notoginsengisoli]